MHSPLIPLACAMAAATLAAACAETLFEDVHAVPWPKKERGYRGNNGDFLVLGDGAVAMAYMSQANIVARKSADRGKTWGEEYLLVAKPKPAALLDGCDPISWRLPGQPQAAYPGSSLHLRCHSERREESRSSKCLQSPNRDPSRRSG